METCKKCGRPITTAPVFHTSCMEGLMGIMCDDYCRWPREVRSQTELDEKCDTCKIAALFRKEG